MFFSMTALNGNNQLWNMDRLMQINLFILKNQLSKKNQKIILRQQQIDIPIFPAVDFQ